MKLERIILENFRQYFGRQRLDFAKDQEYKVTVIHGANGAGKTSLFLAINWCLYGEDSNNVGELISKEAINRAGPGERVQALVELSFLHDGYRYLVRRSLQAIKQSDGSIQFHLDSSGDFIMMRTRRDGQAEKIGNPIGAINAILPANVRTYFLFDGEKIDDFAKPEASGQVKEAIYLVLKLEILERARRHLEGSAQDYRRELKTVSSAELRNLIDRAERALAERTSLEAKRAEFIQEIESARRKITDIEQQLREMQNAKVLQQERDRIERELKQRQSEYDMVINQIRDLATGSYLAGAQIPINHALRILEEKRERGEIPSSIRQQFVKDLIEQMRCICGRPFTDGSPEHQRLLNLMNSSLPGSLEDEVLDLSAALRSLEESIDRQASDLHGAMRQRAVLVDSIKSLEAELDDIGRQLKGSPLEEVSRLEQQRQEFQADIDHYNIDIGSLRERIEKLTKESVQLQSDIVNARKRERHEKLLGIKLDLAQRAADAIGEMYQAFADDMRTRIQSKTKEIFKLLVWKDSHFQDIQLGPDFKLEVIDRYGLPARPELSAGERQVLSLSFITAMSRISEEEAPLVMDTPFGRLSSQHRNSITEHLPDLADQLVIFVTDEELRGQARINLEGRIGAEYQLLFDPNTSCTEIMEVRR